jgi:pyruvate/2-oxoglutarate dehydrogenase complex dihydrolipoamide dehydrogenase (E3) component
MLGKDFRGWSAMNADRYDAVIIGAGQGGGPLATALADAGRRTALIERAEVGGTCINEGCTPTKTMVASARVAWLVRRAADYGVMTGEVHVDIATVRQRKREIVASFRSGAEQRIEEADGLELLRGDACFTSPKTLAVATPDGTREIISDLIVIDVGARPLPPRLPGLDRVRALDSTSIMELDVLPEHLIVLGGGYVGLEFAQMFRRFGSEVTVIQRGPKLLGREDDDVADAVAEILREDGITVLLNSEARSVEPAVDGGVRLTATSQQGDRDVNGSHLLVAVGRAPNTGDLGLDRTGVETNDRGFIRVDERLQTNVPGVYAIGDVTGGPAFTHISYDDFRILRANLIDGKDATTKERLVPYTVFIDPQLGRVGMTEAEARKQGIAIKVATIPMSSVSRALEVDEPRGLLKAIVDDGTGHILGFAALGMDGGELMAVVQMAMMGKLPYTALRDGVFAHPTLAESLNNLFAALDT